MGRSLVGCQVTSVNLLVLPGRQAGRLARVAVLDVVLRQVEIQGAHPCHVLLRQLDNVLLLLLRARQFSIRTRNNSQHQNIIHTEIWPGWTRIRLKYYGISPLV